MRIAFIINGKLRKSDKFKAEIKDSIASTRHIATVVVTERKGHAIDLAKAYADHDAVVGIGGDGTMNEILNGVMLSGKRPTLGCLPHGTANDLAKTIGVTASLSDLFRLIDNGLKRKIDVGKTTYIKADGKGEAVRYFINVTDAGIGGYVVERVANTKLNLGGKMNFMRAVAESFLQYEQSTVRITGDEFNWEGKLLTLAVANGKYYGSGMCIAPEAEIDDGLLNVVIIHDISATDYLRHIRKFRKEERVEHPKIQYHQTKRLTIKPLDLACPIDIDGEFLGHCPATIEVIPEAVEVWMN